MKAGDFIRVVDPDELADVHEVNEISFHCLGVLVEECLEGTYVTQRGIKLWRTLFRGVYFDAFETEFCAYDSEMNCWLLPTQS